MERIGIIGAGSFGTALAQLLAENGHSVSLWTRRKELVEHINQKHQNPFYSPEAILPSAVTATNNMEECVKSSLVVVLAVPSPYVKQALKEAKNVLTGNQILMHVIKGIDDSGMLMSQLIAQELPHIPLAVLSGPNHAEEVCRRLPTATVIASSHRRTRETLCSLFSSPRFKTYPHDDVAGVEVCGAVKNVVAIAMGVCEGLGFGDNTKGSILTLGLSEMGTIAKTFGAKRSTCFGLAGVGDLVATCFSKHSRNRFVGEMLAKGKSMEEISKEMHGMVAEGVRNTRILHQLCTQRRINAPLITQAYRVLYEGVDLRKGVDKLLLLV